MDAVIRSFFILLICLARWSKYMRCLGCDLFIDAGLENDKP